MRIFYLFLAIFAFHSDMKACQTIYLESQAEVNSFPLDYPDCTIIDGDLVISGNVSDLSPLNGITGIEQSLWFTNCYYLVSMEGLSNLVYAGDLKVSNCTLFENFLGLSSLGSLGNLMVEACSSFEDFSGLEGITGLEGIWLNDLIIQNGFNGLQNISGSVSIFVLEFCEVNSFEGLSGIVEILDLFISFGHFPAGFTGLSSWNSASNIALESVSVENFQGLENLQVVENSIAISGSGSPLSIMNLEGLGSIEILGELAIINSHIESLEGISATAELGEIWVEDCPDLLTLDGLENYTTASSIVLNHLNSLQNLSGLSGYLSIGTLEISSCVGLNSLEELNDDLVIEDYLLIMNNSEMSVCSITPVCIAIADATVDVQIDNNQDGCNSIEEIAFNCQLSTVSGNIYGDANCNLVVDPEEVIVPNHMIVGDLDEPLAFSDSNGHFVDYLLQNEVVSYSCQEPIGFQSNEVIISNGDFVENYPETNLFLCPVEEIHDLSISVSAASFRPGFNTLIHLNIENNGTMSENCTVQLDLTGMTGVTIEDADNGIVEGLIINWQNINLNFFTAIFKDF